VVKKPLSTNRKPKLTEAQDNDASRARLPTDAEIAAMLRHRPIGAVLTEPNRTGPRYRRPARPDSRNDQPDQANAISR
jgi:hypothetical protein